jgi:hypothetical protein
LQLEAHAVRLPRHTKTIHYMCDGVFWPDGHCFVLEYCNKKRTRKGNNITSTISTAYTRAYFMLKFSSTATEV